MSCGPRRIGFHRCGRTYTYRSISAQTLHALGIALPQRIDRDNYGYGGHPECYRQHLCTMSITHPSYFKVHENPKCPSGYTQVKAKAACLLKDF